MVLDRKKKHVAAAIVGGVVFALSGTALAAPCDFANAPTARYIVGAGGSAATATIGRVAAALRQITDPITVYFHDPGACLGFEELIQGKLDASSTTTVKYWNADGSQQTCDVPADVDVPVQFGHMGNTADFCVGYEGGLPDGFEETLAPVQTVNVFTDVNSSQRSISAEALYYIYGLGAANANIAPWTNPAHLAFRARDSFVHQFIAYSVFNDVGKVFYDNPNLSTGGNQRLGTQVQTNGASINHIIASGATSAESPLGYASGSAVDAQSTRVKTLAYQHFGQECAYWPDSTESTLDKVNVRKGLYYFWTPGHFYYPEDQDPDVQEFIGYFTGELESPSTISGPTILERIILAGDIPICAMEVSREGTAGPIFSAAPAEPCGCYFEAKATGNASVCDPCTEDNDCSGSQKCRYGYCEAY